MADQDRDQRTEQATPQRLRKAFEEGQIGFSADLVGGAMLSVGALFFFLMGEAFFGSLGDSIRNRMTFFHPMIEDPKLIPVVLANDVKFVGAICLGLMISVLATALLAGAMQTNFNVTFKPLALKWDKLSVPAGFKRIFSLSSVVRGALSIVKASVIVAIIYFVSRNQLLSQELAGFGSFQELMFTACRIMIWLAIAISTTMGVIGIIDLAYQKWKQSQDLMMSIQDIKDEHKESEGDPLMKARIKRLQAEMGRGRMLADVPKASVIVTNPTHFAVAIQYDRETMEAPIIVAKGADFLAKKIISIGKENGVPVVERKPVARFLYANTEVGNEVPYELYQAVAEIINYVNQLDQNKRAG